MLVDPVTFNAVNRSRSDLNYDSFVDPSSSATLATPEVVLTASLCQYLLPGRCVDPNIGLLYASRLVHSDVRINRISLFLIDLKVIYHPLYGMNNYVLIWGDWLSCDPLRGSHDSQSPHIRKHLCPILWQL